jgi:hypothetical protein
MNNPEDRIDSAGTLKAASTIEVGQIAVVALMNNRLLQGRDSHFQAVRTRYKSHDWDQSEKRRTRADCRRCTQEFRTSSCEESEVCESIIWGSQLIQT